MKNLFIVIFPLLLLGVTGCKSTPCDDPASLPSKTASYITAKWECRNSVKVRKDISNWMAEREWCTSEKERKEGFILTLVCTFIGNRLQQVGVDRINNELRWDCNPDLIGKDAKAAFIAICSSLPF